jgi:hypothetical protein
MSKDRRSQSRRPARPSEERLVLRGIRSSTTALFVSALVISIVTGCSNNGPRDGLNIAGPQTVTSRSSGDRTPTPTAGDSSKGSGSPTTSTRRHTYSREGAGGVYLDSLPGNEGEPEPDPEPPTRISNGGVALASDELHLHESIGHWPFRITSATGRPINRTVRIVGPNAQDFPLFADSCRWDGCKPPEFYCAKAVCEFSSTFSPTGVGRRTATLVIGEAQYQLTGIGIPGVNDRSASTSGTTSTTLSGPSSTSSVAKSTVEPSSTTSATTKP